MTIKLGSLLYKSLNYLVNILSHGQKTPLLPEPLYLLGTSFFPQVNVELIIRDLSDQTIYLWRDDELGNLGWHLPGGIIRPNESIDQRINKVILNELPFLASDQLQTNPTLLGLSEVFSKTKPSIRSHHISLIYLCVFNIKFTYSHFGNYPPHRFTHFKYWSNYKVPDNLISNHKRYIPLLKMPCTQLKKIYFPIITSKN